MRIAANPEIVEVIIHTVSCGEIYTHRLDLTPRSGLMSVEYDYYLNQPIVYDSIIYGYYEIAPKERYTLEALHITAVTPSAMNPLIRQINTAMIDRSKVVVQTLDAEKTLATYACVCTLLEVPMDTGVCHLQFAPGLSLDR